MLSQLELADQKLRQSGRLDQWLRGCDSRVKAVSEAANSLLLAELLAASAHCDLACAELFREGVPWPTIGVSRPWGLCCVGAHMYGSLECSGVGMPVFHDDALDTERLKQDCLRTNLALLRELREDQYSDDLMRITQEDASLGRMTWPRELDLERDRALLGEVLLNPRFGVAQAKEDGSVKVRAVDNLSWGPVVECELTGKQQRSKKARKWQSVNGNTAPAEKMHPDTLDVLAACLRSFVELEGSGQIPGLLKVR